MVVTKLAKIVHVFVSQKTSSIPLCIWEVVTTPNLRVATMHQRPTRALLFLFLLIQCVRPENIPNRTGPC
jgi:hypothetical protein